MIIRPRLVHTQRIMPSRMCGTILPVLGAALLLASPQTAWAQEKIEQMIVTATKRAQDIQSVPASISAFSAEGLEEKQIQNVQDLSGIAANVHFNQVSGSFPSLSIRGISAEGSSPMFEGTVALHVDGVYQPRVVGMDLFLADLDSVEILRGPQGTLYGRNANAGVVNLNTAKPTDYFEGSATVFGGSYKRYGAKGYVSGPVTDGISMRVSAMVDRREGWAKNLVTGSRIDGHYDYGGRFSVRLEPTDSVTVDLSYTHVLHRDTKPLYFGSEPAQGPGLNYTLLQQQGYDARYTLEPWRVYNGYDPETKTKMDMGTGIINWDIAPDVSLKSITGWQYVTYHQYIDSDAMPVDYLNNLPFADSHTLSQEFNLNAKLWDRIDAVAGLFYLKDTVRGASVSPLPLGNPVGSAVTQGLLIYGRQDQDTTSKAVFLDLTVNVTDELRLLAGVRRTWDKKETIQYNTNLVGTTNHDVNTGTMLTTCAGGLVHPVPDLNYASTTGKFGIQYDFTPNIMGYVSWQNGFKDGGYNQSACDNSFQAEQVYSWEAGVKSSLFDDRLTLNISAFDYKYANMQLSRTVARVVGSITTFATLIDNAASAKIRGVEVEGSAYLTDDILADLSVGYLDSEYGTLLSVNPVVPGVVVDIAGNTPPRSPKLTLSAGLEHTMRLGSFGELKSRAEYKYTGKQYFTAFNEAIAKQDAYSLVNLFFTVTPDDSPFSFQVYAKNLLDKPYKYGGFTSGTLRFSRVI